jgi:hypothetical protein
VANRGDNEEAPLLLEQLPGEVRYVLGDTHYNTPELHQEGHWQGWELVATRRRPYPHRNDGVAVRKVFHKLRSQAIEPFNGLFKNIFEWRVKMPVQGLQRSQLLALGAQAVIESGLIYDHVSLSCRPQSCRGRHGALRCPLYGSHIRQVILIVRGCHTREPERKETRCCVAGRMACG